MTINPRFSIIRTGLAVTILVTCAFWLGRAGEHSNSQKRTPPYSRQPAGTVEKTPPIKGSFAPINDDWTQFALVVVDVQNDFFTQDLEARFPNYAKNIRELLSFSRAQGIEVIHVRTEFASSTDLSPSFQVIFPDHVPCLRGTMGAQATSFAGERPGEPIYYKTNFNGFSVDGLSRHLEMGGKRHLLIAGLTTDLCVFSTVVGAVDKGFIVSVVDDCCLASSEVAHNFVIHHFDGFLFDTVSHLAIGHRKRRWLDQLQLIKPQRATIRTGESFKDTSNVVGGWAHSITHS